MTTEDFIWIKPGTFQMGSPETEDDRDDDESLHEVEITHGFWLAKAPVTVLQWISIMGEKPCEWIGEQPVTNVSWDDAQAFIAALNRREPGAGYRLPTEAEWEYACRAGTTTARYWGEDISPEHARYATTYGGDEVCSFPPNPWGLYDMLGLVWEWCEDEYGFYAQNTGPDPTGSVERVLRGGCWAFSDWFARSAQRLAIPPDIRYAYGGFRLARGGTS